MERRQAMVGVTVAPLGEAASAVAWAGSIGIRGIQWGATRPGARPRELGASARRDIRALFVRHEVECCGVDAMVPAAHLVDPQLAERALDAVADSCAFAADLGAPSVTLQLPATPDAQDARAVRSRQQAVEAIVAAADRVGVLVADLAGGIGAPWPPVGIAVDPAAVLAESGDPAAVVSRAGARVVGARIVDLRRGGMRGPLGGGSDARLDVLSFRIALETAGFTGLPVIDCRQWDAPREGVVGSLAEWSGHPG